MKRIMVLFSIVLVAAALAPLPAVPGETMKCAECGMMVDQGSKFSALIEGDAKTILPFCDIGDLLVYLNKKSLAPATARVKEYKTGEWISADKAFYVHAEKAFKTPMGWGIAAFKNREDAAAYGTPRDLNGIMRAVK
ncbi:MAG TPA: nitrous oxide reductase accessory protein NosL [Nitrospirota bacterium]|nr:nitrous oxide reductase accessory protein NosL [Nitrospirota bacterium]